MNEIKKRKGGRELERKRERKREKGREREQHRGRERESAGGQRDCPSLLALMAQKIFDFHINASLQGKYILYRPDTFTITSVCIYCYTRVVLNTRVKHNL